MDHDDDDWRKLRVGLTLFLCAHGLFGGVLLCSRLSSESVAVGETKRPAETVPVTAMR